jgi:DNA-directed RNA polymerase subunit RPC12/RpoP
MDKTMNQTCPICNKEVMENQRYPNYVCEDCSEKAVTDKGEKVKFYNAEFLGFGVTAKKEDNSIYSSDICYIEGIKCKASEARFGGIVIMPILQ